MSSPIFVNRPQGGIVPDNYKPSDVPVFMGARFEPKIGCVDNGQKTREDRVVLEWGGTIPGNVRRTDEWTASNRKGDPYTHMDSGQLDAIIDKLAPLRRQGFSVFDCGFFPQGKRAGDLVIYGLPVHKNDQDNRITYAASRKVLEAIYPIHLDRRVVYQFSVLMLKKNEHGIPCLNGVPEYNPSEHLREHSNGIVSEAPAWHPGSPIDHYWYDLDDKADLGQQVYILPSFKSGEYIDTLWQAMKECPDTTYEGFVIKNENFPEVYTDKQSDNETWTRIRYR